MRNNGILYALFLCCGWPLIVLVIYNYATRNLSAIRWDLIRWPWSRHD
jgi:hypothetical protein